MENLRMRHLLAPVLIVMLATACANRCTEPQPARSYFKDETPAQRLMREKQDAADFEALQAEKAYERMSDEERMKGVVYE
ncbi:MULTISPECIES: hypothetical protein [unclassified Neisseria]|uniref:hypothetical protein n=1 Tax=unclassified Neisseria TaxID=2623750 RepID=UPI002666F159|nr:MULTISPECIES: hypothetical protein [unclassified Neisseria]MDO1509974.1 hypothetical protein [Neisseria sp. MVDL19-042950]MDO1516174.1 hypothetical protein [Neisseria sp. MVDL18-041461]MDO1563289.1 hypothetical protein [Neisseria sp. MVDL20-010259]